MKAVKKVKVEELKCIYEETEDTKSIEESRIKRYRDLNLLIIEKGRKNKSIVKPVYYLEDLKSIQESVKLKMNEKRLASFYGISTEIIPNVLSRQNCLIRTSNSKSVLPNLINALLSIVTMPFETSLIIFPSLQKLDEFEYELHKFMGPISILKISSDSNEKELLLRVNEKSYNLILATCTALSNILKNPLLKVNFLQSTTVVLLYENNLFLSFGIQNVIPDVLTFVVSNHQLISIGESNDEHESHFIHHTLDNYIKISQIHDKKISIPERYDVKSTFIWIENPSKPKKLCNLLWEDNVYKPPVVIFVESVSSAESLEIAIKKKCNCSVRILKNFLSIKVESDIISEFKSGTVDVFIVLGNYMNINELIPKPQVVICFDAPSTFTNLTERLTIVAEWFICLINSDHQSLFPEISEFFKSKTKLTPLPKELLKTLF